MYTYIGSNSMHYWISIISKYNFLIYQLLQIMWLMLIFQGLVGHCDRKHFFCSKLPLCFYRFIQALGLLLFTHFCLGWNIRRNNGPSFFFIKSETTGSNVSCRYHNLTTLPYLESGEESQF